jgi:hypothetical protein
MAVGAIGALGAIASIGGTVVSFIGQRQAAKAQETMAKRQAHFSKRAEAAREQQMRLEASRQRRQQFRQGILARAEAVSAGVNQGAQLGSGVAGGAAQATGTALQGQQTATAAETLGGHIFEANRGFHEAGVQGARQIAKAQSLQAMGGFISSFGGAVVNAAPTISRVGTYFGSQRTA